jgi:hypothetical protein
MISLFIYGTQKKSLLARPIGVSKQSKAKKDRVIE